MVPSDRFLKVAHKYLKDHRESDSDARQRAAIGDLARGKLSSLPGDLVDELLDHVLERTEEAGDGPEGLAQRLGDLIDLFNGEYDEQNDPFDRRDWEAVGSAVSDTAHELEMETLNYVMKLVVDHHGL